MAEIKAVLRLRNAKNEIMLNRHMYSCRNAIEKGLFKMKY